MSLALPFDNTYARLPERFFTSMAPSPVRAPELMGLNEALAQRLGLDPAALASDEGISVLSGNTVPEAAEPLAQVYAGHQFGGWSPRLGDGRAILLGEVVAPDGARFDLQLKGSGQTPYSRSGDGRAWIGPVLREYIVSEAMAALGVPTTRALAAVATGESVMRETVLPGAVLTRVASSHIRVGTFQYFAARNDEAALTALVEHALARHYPQANGALGLLRGVIERQAQLVAKWMGLGFIHGVMNTDNVTISGETIDYGPCALIDTYHPLRVFSSIDHQGRYAYARQPDIMMWNLAQLATSLLPLIDTVEDAQAEINLYPDLFRDEWLKVFRPKIGLAEARDGDAALIHDLMDRMAEGQADFTNTFRALGTDTARDQFVEPTAYDDWHAKWAARLREEGATAEARLPDMQRTNPAVIPRTHRIEAAIQSALIGDLEPFHRLNRVLLSPFDLSDDDASLARPPTEEEVVPRTFCGT
ncbi:MAG: YdiU family protein [Pseudomonadota bacterium]